MNEKEMLTSLLGSHGLTGKFVREYCRLQGWRINHGGIPDEWFAAWQGGLGNRLDAIIDEGVKIRRSK